MYCQISVTAVLKRLREKSVNPLLCSKWRRSCTPIRLPVAVRSDRVLFNRISLIIHSHRAGALSQVKASIKWICLRWKNLHWDLKYDRKLLRACIIHLRKRKVKLQRYFSLKYCKILEPRQRSVKEPEWGSQRRWDH